MDGIRLNAAAAEIRARAVPLRRLVGALAVVLLCVLLPERFGLVLIEWLRDGWSGEVARHFAHRLALIAPELCWLTALWGVRQALAAIARGELYAATVARMLERVGALLGVGALINVFIVPAIDRALGLNPGYWIAVDISGLVLGAMGLALTLLARVLRHAARMQTELDGIF